MHAIEFLRDPSRVPVRPVYAVWGDDPFLRREVLQAIGRQVLEGTGDELGATRFEGETATLADVLDEVHTLPFLAARRLVVVAEADSFVAAHRKDLEAFAERTTGSGVLVLSVKQWPATTRLAKLVEKVGLAVECKGPHERELPSWLVQVARSRCRVQLDEDAARLLVELVGAEVGLLVGEVEKLAVYVGERARVRRDDVAILVGAGRIDTVWKALDAATTGRGGLALDLLDRLLAAGESPVGLLAAARASLIKLHHAGQLRKAQRDLREACRLAGIYPGSVEKTQQQHAHLGPRRVGQIPALLLQADLDLKGSSTLAPRVVLERLFVTLARPRED